MKIARRTLLVGAGALALTRFVGGRSAAGHSVDTATTAPASQETLASLAAENATIVKLGSGGFRTLEAALASITDASSGKVYRIQAEANPDGYEMKNLVWKAGVELEGLGEAPVLFKCELPASADPIAASYTQPLHATEGARFINVHVRAKNCRYPLDMGALAMVPGEGQVPAAVGCQFEHLGNDEICARAGVNNNEARPIGGTQRIGTNRMREGLAFA